MIYLDRVLFPTDGSDCAEQARRYATRLADRFDANLHVIHVEEREADLSDVIDICEEDVLADLHAPYETTSALAEPRIKECRVVHPSAAGGILSYATEHDANLIVLGTHGRSGVQRLVLGSVAEEVVRQAPCPVVTVGRGSTADGNGTLDDGRLLVPIDFSEHQDDLLAHAGALARAFGMEIVFLHVVEVGGLPDVYGISSTPPDADVLSDRTQKVLEERAETLRKDGLRVTVEVRNGRPANEIPDAAADLEVNAVAIATHGRAGLDRMLMGSVAEAVVRRAPCPVFTVKSLGPSLVEEATALSTSA